MMKYVCLGPGAARAARCGHCWAEERVNFGQRNGLKPDPQTDVSKNIFIHRQREVKIYEHGRFTRRPAAMAPSFLFSVL